jgi:hypothetical protein
MGISRLKDLKIERLFFYLLICNLIIFESISAQSFFAMRGFGEEILFSDANASGLGGLVNLSRENPSFPLDLNKTSFYANVLSGFVYGKQGTSSRMIYDIRPLMVEGKIPLPYQFRIGLKLSEMFNQNFDIYSDSLQFSGYWTRRHIIGKGGIYRLGGNIGKTLFNQKLSCGVEYSKLFGQGLEQWYFDVLDGNYLTLDSVITAYSAHNLRFGITADVASLTLGITVEDILPGIINSRVMSHNSIVDSVSGLKFDLPYGIGFGVIVDKLPQTKFYLDFLYKNWSNTKIANAPVTKFQNSTKYSLAVEHWLTDYRPLRIGLRYYSSYLLDHTNSQIKEYALTGGSSVVIPKFGYFDYSLEIIQRNGTEVKETIGRINFSLSFEEIWKKRTRRWGY